MSNKEDRKKTDSRPEPKSEKKQSETVQLSAEELRKISGGAKSVIPPKH